jgi:hypothetical protein
MMIGRSPEFLGKKIEAREIKLVMLAVLAHPISILGFTALAAVWPTAKDSLNNVGPHGFSEILYAYTSGTTKTFTNPLCGCWERPRLKNVLGEQVENRELERVLHRASESARFVCAPLVSCTKSDSESRDDFFTRTV